MGTNEALQFYEHGTPWTLHLIMYFLFVRLHAHTSIFTYYCVVIARENVLVVANSPGCQLGSLQPCHLLAPCILAATHLALCLHAISRVQVQLPLRGCICVDLGHELLQLHLLLGLELVGQGEVELATVGLQGDPWEGEGGWKVVTLS